MLTIKFARRDRDKQGDDLRIRHRQIKYIRLEKHFSNRGGNALVAIDEGVRLSQMISIRGSTTDNIGRVVMIAISSSSES